MEVGTTIKSFRKKLGISQEQLAEISNITQAYLSQIENNKKDPNLSTLKAVCDALNIPISVLFLSSISEDDVPEGKKEAYQIMAPAMKEMITSLFSTSYAD